MLMHETVLRPGALGRPRGTGWRGRWEGASGWGTHVNPWLFEKKSSVLFCLLVVLLDGILSPGQLVITCSDPDHRFKFSPTLE